MKKQLLLLLITAIATINSAETATSSAEKCKKFYPATIPALSFKKYGSHTARNLARDLGATSVLGGVAGLTHSFLNKEKRALLFGKDANGKRFYRRLRDRATQKALAQFVGSLAAIGLGSTALYKNWDSIHEKDQEKATNKAKFTAAVHFQQAWKAVHTKAGGQQTVVSLLFNSRVLQEKLTHQERELLVTPDNLGTGTSDYRKDLEEERDKTRNAIYENSALLRNAPEPAAPKVQPITYPADSVIAANIAAYEAKLSADLEQKAAADTMKKVAFDPLFNSSTSIAAYNALLNKTKTYIELGGFKQPSKGLFSENSRFFEAHWLLNTLRTKFNEEHGTSTELMTSDIPEVYQITGSSDPKDYLTSLITNK